MRKYLQGELAYVEGKATVEELIKQIAITMSARDWRILRRNGSDVPWSFDINREIVLGEPHKKDYLKLFRPIAKAEVIQQGLSTGRIKVLQDPTDSGTLNLTLNGKTYLIPFTGTQTKAQVATAIKEMIAAVDVFATTTVEGTDVVLISGTETVYELATNYQITASSTAVVTEITESKTNTCIVEVLTEALSAGTVGVTINGMVVSVNISLGDTAEDIAEALAIAIKSASPDLSLTKSIGSSVYINGLININTLSSPALVTEEVALKLSLIGSTGSILVLNDATSTGSVDLSVSIGGGAITTITVPVIKDQTKNSVATAIYNEMVNRWGSANLTISENVISIAEGKNITSLTSTQSIPENSNFIFARTFLPSRNMGKIKVTYVPGIASTLTVLLPSASEFKISILTTDTASMIATKIANAIATENIYVQTQAIDDTVYILGETDLVSIVSNAEIAVSILALDSKIVKPDTYAGKITVEKTVYENTSLTIMVNKKVYSVPVLATDEITGIATKISTALKAVATLADTSIVGNIVTIKGSASVTECTIDPVEIPDTSFDISGNILTGVGVGDVGTQVGDNVIIKISHSYTIFDFSNIKETKDSSGNSIAYAKIKGRPLGKVKVFESITRAFAEEILSSDNQTYKISRGLIVDSNLVADRISVKVGATSETATVVDFADMVIDYLNGVVYLKTPAATEASKLFISGKYFVEDELGLEIPESDYQVIGDLIFDKTLARSLKDKNITVGVDYSWSLMYPANFELIDSSNPRVLLKTSVDISSLKNRSVMKDYYVEIKSPPAVEMKLTGMEMRFGTKLDAAAANTLDASLASPWARIAWYRSAARKSNEVTFGNWLPVKFWMNYTEEYLNLVVQGDPGADTTDCNNYLISHAYIGMLKEYDNAKKEDRENNFAMTVGSDVMPYSVTTWGNKTANGVTDVIMYKTDSSIPYQAHYTAFYALPEFMDKHFVGPSEITGQFHFSEITVLHGNERERGKMQSVIIGDRSTIFHLDTMISNKDNFNALGALLDEKGEFINRDRTSLIVSKEKEWKIININSPFWHGINSPNTFFGVALRKR